MEHSSLLWSSLNILTKERYDAIRQVFGSLDEAAKHLNEELLKGLGCRPETILRVLNQAEEFDRALTEAEIRKKNVQFISIDDSAYPARLLEIPDPPVFLYALGDLSILGQPTIGLVGTREMSRYGRRVAQDFVPDFVRAGMVTVSGLALGIDSEVAEQTLKARGKTVAVLAHGLSRIYPQGNRTLADEIVAGGGLLLSEFSIFQEPERYMFPSRNRLIAGLSLATVVLEAPEGSGALITAELALDYNRDVFLVPGPIFDANYRGSNAFIAKGQGKLVQSAREVLEEMGVVVREAPAASAYVPQDKDETALWTALTTMPQAVDELVEKSGLSASVAGATLTMMELQGAVQNVGGGMWVRA